MSRPPKVPSGRLPVMGQEPTVRERADAARNRAKILKVARRMLAKSPAAISMDALAEEAGVGKGTLYRRFPDRSSLVHALLDHDTRELQHWALDGCGLGHGANHLEQALALLGGIFDFNLDHASLLCEATRGTGPSLEHPAYTWQRATLVAHLSKGAKKGDVAPLDPKVTAELMLGGVSPERARWLAAAVSPAHARKALLNVWRRALTLQIGGAAPPG